MKKTFTTLQMKAPAIGLTLALAVHCGVGAQSQQPPATTPAATAADD